MSETHTRRSVHLLALLITALTLLACGRAGQGPDSPAAAQPGKPVHLWIEVQSNLRRVGSVESMTGVLTRVADMGMTGIVLEVNPYAGLVVYDSDIALRLERWPMRNNPDDMWEFNPEFDRLAEACRIGHELGLEVYAGLNIFSEGRKRIALTEGRDRGWVFNGRADWGVVDYVIPPGEEEPRLIPTAEHEMDYAAFVSPHNPEVVEYELAVLREIVANYPVDGVILDRVRFNGPQSDFSPYARTALEARIGHPIEHWPEDVYTRTGPGGFDIERGPLFDEWQLCRAQAIHDFIVQARQVVRETNPEVVFGDYVGAWYPLYFDVGVNWAPPTFEPRWEGFPPGWPQAGYADELDLLMVGIYYTGVTPDEIHRADGRTDEWLCVEGGAALAMEITGGEVPTLGSLFAGQYGYESETGEYMLDRFERSLRAAYNGTDGLMIFDLVHFDEFDLWDTVAEFMDEVR